MCFGRAEVATVAQVRCITRQDMSHPFLCRAPRAELLLQLLRCCSHAESPIAQKHSIILTIPCIHTIHSTNLGFCGPLGSASANHGTAEKVCSRSRTALQRFEAEALPVIPTKRSRREERQSSTHFRKPVTPALALCQMDARSAITSSLAEASTNSAEMWTSGRKIQLHHSICHVLCSLLTK